MAQKYDPPTSPPPGYPQQQQHFDAGPAFPQQSYQDPRQNGAAGDYYGSPGPNQQPYYGGPPPQGGYYGPPPQGGYYGQPQQGMYYQQQPVGYYDDRRGGGGVGLGTGLCAGLCAGLCCLDLCLFF